MDNNDLRFAIQSLLAGEYPKVDDLLDEYEIEGVEQIYRSIHAALVQLGNIDAAEFPLEESLSRHQLYAEILDLITPMLEVAPTARIEADVVNGGDEKKEGSSLEKRDATTSQWISHARDQGVDNTSFAGRLTRYVSRKQMTVDALSRFVGGGVTSEDLGNLIGYMEREKKDKFYTTHFPSLALAERIADVLDIRDTKRELFLSSRAFAARTTSATEIDFKDDSRPTFTAEQVEVYRWRQIVEKRKAFYAALSEAAGKPVTADDFATLTGGASAGVIYGLRPPRNYHGDGLENLVQLAIKHDLITPDDAYTELSESPLAALRKAEEAFLAAASNPLDIRDDWSLVSDIAKDYEGTSVAAVKEIAFALRSEKVKEMMGNLSGESSDDLEARAEAAIDTGYMGARRYPLKLHGAPTLYASPEAVAEIKSRVEAYRKATMLPEGWSTLSSLSTKHRTSHGTLREYVEASRIFLGEYYTPEEIEEKYIRTMPHRNGTEGPMVCVSEAFATRMKHDLGLVPSHIDFGKNEEWSTVSYYANNTVHGDLARVRNRSFSAREKAVMHYTEHFSITAEPELAALAACHMVDAHLMGYRPTRSGLISFQFSDEGKKMYDETVKDITGSHGWTNDNKVIRIPRTNALSGLMEEFQNKFIPVLEAALQDHVPNPRAARSIAKHIVETQVVGQRYRNLTDTTYSQSPTWLVHEDYIDLFKRVKNAPDKATSLIEANVTENIGEMILKCRHRIAEHMPEIGHTIHQPSGKPDWKRADQLGEMVGDFRIPFFNTLLTKVHAALEKKLSDNFYTHDSYPAVRPFSSHAFAISTIRNNIMDVGIGEGGTPLFRVAPVLAEAIKKADLYSVRGDNYRERASDKAAEEVCDTVLASLRLNRDPVMLGLSRAKAGEIPFGSGVLKMAREQKGDEQSTLFKAMGVSKDTYMRWENDKRPVASQHNRAGMEKHREYIADYLGVSGIEKIEAKLLAEGVFVTDVRKQQRLEFLDILREIPGFGGLLLQAVMDQNNHDRTELGKRLEVSPRSIEHWLKGGKIQQRATAERLADYIGYLGEDKAFFVETMYHHPAKPAAGEEKSGKPETVAGNQTADDGNPLGRFAPSGGGHGGGVGTGRR